MLSSFRYACVETCLNRVIWYKNISSHIETNQNSNDWFICTCKTSVKNEYMNLFNYFEDSKYFNLFALLKCIEFRQKNLRAYSGWSWWQKLDNAHIPFLKILFLISRPDIHSKTVNFFLSSESFIPNEIFVFLLNAW